MHDRGASGLVSCSSGAVSASGTLRLQLGDGDAAAAAAAAAGGGGGGDGGGDGWRHVTLDLEIGKAGRMAMSLEAKMVQASEAGDAAVDRLAARVHRGSGADGAEAAAAEQPATEQPVAEGGAGTAVAAPEAAAAADAAGTGTAAGGPEPGRSGDVFVDVPLEESQGQVAEGTLAASTVRVRLSYRPLRAPPSAALESGLPGLVAARAATAAAATAGQRRQLIRLISRVRPGEEQGGEEQGGGAAAAAAPGAEAAEAAAEEAEAADSVQAGLPLELPLDALPRRLHTYGHGAFMGAALSMLGDAAWQRILHQEDRAGFTAARR